MPDDTQVLQTRGAGATQPPTTVATWRREPRRRLRLERYPGAKVDPEGAESLGARLLWRAGENFRPPGHLEALESSRRHGRLELCLQQSAGDSTFPQVRVTFRFLGDGLLYDDVPDL